MRKGDARRLADALDGLIEENVRAALGGWPLDTRQRLRARLTRHLPLDGAAEASEFAPPMWTVTVARKAGLPLAQAVGLAAVGTAYFATADLADDIADGDLVDDIGLHVTDVCRLTFLYQKAIGRVPDLDDRQRHAIADVLAAHGLDMADGQELDLRSTDALESAEPPIIARYKSGAEFAALGEMIAIVGGFDRSAWRTFGSAFGTGAQITSDYFDLFLDPDSDDWAAAKPTVPIRRALADPAQTEAVHRLLAGRRSDPARKSAGLWHLVQADAAGALRSVLATAGADMNAALEPSGKPKVLGKMRGAVIEIGTAIAEALDEYRADPRPPVTPIEAERGPCLTRARSFLDRAATTPIPGADLLGALIVAEAALDAGEPPDRVELDRLLDGADDDGIRRHPGRSDLPPDADATGRLIRLAAVAGRRDHPAVLRGADALIAHTRRDGLIHTWLEPRGRQTPERPGPICPVTVAVALHGLWTLDPDAHRKRVLKGAAMLARLLERGPPQCRSAFYRQAVVEARVCRFMLDVRDAAGRRDRAAIDAALVASAARSTARRRLDGRLGDILGTAVRASALIELKRAGLADLPCPAAIARALIDAQNADGGFPAERCFRALGTEQHDDWIGDRRLTTALVHRALVAIDV